MDLLLFLLEMDHLGRLLLGGRFFFSCESGEVREIFGV